jgi:phospholipid/cholesterol/gamma-HCH transport system substrate-binding protein
MMDERVLSFRVGVVVIASAIVTAVLVMLFGAWPTMLQPQYTLHILFPEAPGITVDTPVRKSGVLIGRVSRVELLDEGGVLVSMNINQNFTLRRNETCRIGTGSLLGDAVLEFVPAGTDELLARFDVSRNGRLDPEEEMLAREVLTDGDFLSDGVVAANPVRVLVNLEQNISTAFASIQNAGDEVASVARSVNAAMDGTNGSVPRLLEKTERALDGLSDTMRTVQNLLGDEQLSSQLQHSLREMPLFIRETRETLALARTTLESFQQVSEKAHLNLENLEQFTGPLGQRADELYVELQRSAIELRRTLTNVSQFTESLQDSQGTIGRLVHDDEIYVSIRNVVANAEEVTRRLRPVVEDMRIFTDKIARDPGQLGVRGALERRPSGLKTGVATW